MKTLRKGDEYKRVKDSTKAHWDAIKTLVADGGAFCDKTTWKKMRGEGK